MRFILNSLNLYNGDCLTILKTIEDNSVDLILTDPPYNIGFDSSKETHTFESAWDHKSHSDFENFNYAWLTECYRVLKPNGNLWFFMGPTQIPSLFQTIEKTEWINNLDDWQILYRQKGRGSKHKLKSLSEDIIHLSKDKNFYYNDAEYKSRVIDWNSKQDIPLGWVIDIDKAERVRYSGTGDMECFTQPFHLSKAQKLRHPCQKSIVMLAKFIMQYCPKDSIVLDPFMGSGSSGVAAIASGRHYIGIEQDKQMFEKAEDWINGYNKPEVEKLIKPVQTFGFHFGDD